VELAVREGLRMEQPEFCRDVLFLKSLLDATDALKNDT
jgi:hypothetical protein